MADVLTAEQRHRNMSNIRSKNSKPEIFVRKIAHGLGYRFRLHNSNLPGKPDLTFSRLKKIIFVNGCFWHMHNCRYGKVTPRTNEDFWSKKRLSNVARDKRAIRELRIQGWRCLTIWECQIRKPLKVEKRIKNFLSVK